GRASDAYTGPHAVRADAAGRSQVPRPSVGDGIGVRIPIHRDPVDDDWGRAVADVEPSTTQRDGRLLAPGEVGGGVAPAEREAALVAFGDRQRILPILSGVGPIDVRHVVLSLKLRRRSRPRDAPPAPDGGAAPRAHRAPWSSSIAAVIQA